MVNTQTGYIELTDGKIYYEMAGSGETLVLAHAGFVDSRMWDTQWEAFAEHYTVIRFDMRGFGRSSVLNVPVSRRDDLRKVLDHLNVKQAHLLGCSMSGENVIDYTLEHPEKVMSLIVVSAVPSGFEMQGKPPAELMQMMEAAQKGELEKESELQLRIWVDGPYRTPQEVDRKVREQAAGMNKIPVENGTFMKADMQPLNPLNPPAAGRLGSIKAPTLIIAGAVDNAEIVRAADVMQKAIKGAQKVIIADAAHVPNMDKPAEFNKVVLDFLSNV